MRYIIEISSVKAQAIQSLIEDRKYASIQSFILTAIENQLYLEKQPVEGVMAIKTIKDKPIKGKITDSLASLISLPAEGLSEVVTVDEPQSEALGSETLWALHNRIFPVKVALRVLLNIIKTNPKGDGYVSLWEVQDAAAEEASKLRRKLLGEDKKRHRKHGEKLSTGLPRKGDKSKDRYRSSFVGSINSKGRVEGAPAILRFVNMRRNSDGQPQIGITKAGLDFAILENPILDKLQSNQTLSQEERDFYLQHICKKLTKEYQLSISVLKAINDGNNTPSKLNEVMKKINPNIKDEARSLRSGLISRLIELGLLTRRRTGVKMTYILVNKGLEILASGPLQYRRR